MNAHTVGTMKLENQQQHSVMHGVQEFAARRPETPEEALQILRAMVDCGLSFIAYEPKVAESLASNPMLDRTR